jgi:hypothetical protein
MRYYDELAVYERNGFDIIVEKTYEDTHPNDLFDDCVSDIKQLCEDIECGNLDWFILRVRVLVEGLEIGSSSVGGCLYKDAREVLTDGLAENEISVALAEAKTQVYKYKQKFAELSDMVDREGINV